MSPLSAVGPARLPDGLPCCGIRPQRPRPRNWHRDVIIAMLRRLGTGALLASPLFL
jgi:hypothetical protein